MEILWSLVICLFIWSSRMVQYYCHLAKGLHHVNITVGNTTTLLRGIQLRNYLDEPFAAFLGIPYAKAPIGELRFKDTQKLENDGFNGGTFSAFNDGYECPSITARNQSEDCLHLNVYTKNLNSKELVPVLVVIHPGGLYLLSAASYVVQPNNLLSKDLVLVTFNYRLSSLGFLNFGTANIPGNAGFKDQVFALRWIKTYIRNFGGNPADITLMGYSAGALSASLHLVSPMSQGLFHKAIIMSGSVPPQRSLPQGHQRHLSLRQANLLNCSTANHFTENDGNELLSCFEQFSGRTIAMTLRQMFDFGKDNPIYLWLPVVENDFQQEIFLNQDYYQSLEKLKEFNVPLLIGYTSGEFCSSAVDILNSTILTQNLQNDLDLLFPKIFMYETALQAKGKTAALLDYYLKGNRNISWEQVNELCDLFSDALIRFGAHRMAEILARKTPVYFYEFDYLGEEWSYEKTGLQKRVEHMTDFQYLFNAKDLESHHMIDLYATFLYDFIRHGKLSDPLAKPYPQSYALIQESIIYKEGRNFNKYEFWMQLFRS